MGGVTHNKDSYCNYKFNYFLTLKLLMKIKLMQQTLKFSQYLIACTWRVLNTYLFAVAAWLFTKAINVERELIACYCVDILLFHRSTAVCTFDHAHLILVTNIINTDVDKVEFALTTTLNILMIISTVLSRSEMYIFSSMRNTYCDWKRRTAHNYKEGNFD